MFQEKFEKFKKTVKDYDIITADTRKILIAMSGGKDGATMAHFLLEYKKQVRPDLELQVLTAPMPYWEHQPETVSGLTLNTQQRVLIEEQKRAATEFSRYWGQYFECKAVPVEHDLYKDRILKMNWPCILCFCTKMKGMHRYLAQQPYDDNTLFALGWTKWDAHYTLLSHLLKSNGTKWPDLKKRDPKKYKADCVFLASFLAYPKVDLGIPGKRIFRINPMVEFDDEETGALRDELGFPILKDICKEFHGDMFDQDRRYLSKYLELYSTNLKRMNLPADSFLFSYRNLFRYLTEAEIVPPVEELNGVAYEAYNSNFDDTFEMLRKQDS